jgi:hypothetical protein
MQVPLAVSPKPARIAGAAARKRPSALVPLYVSFSILQVLDVHSTTRAVDNGAAEVNPVMKHVAGSAAAMLAVKAAMTAGVVYATERVWKRHRAAAVIFMIGANSAMSWAVHRNYVNGR